MEPYLLRVADRGRLALVPETEHLAPIVQMSVGDDRARGLDELPMPEHIDRRCDWHGGEPRQRRLAPRVDQLAPPQPRAVHALPPHRRELPAHGPEFEDLRVHVRDAALSFAESFVQVFKPNTRLIMLSLALQKLLLLVSEEEGSIADGLRFADQCLLW